MYSYDVKEKKSKLSRLEIANKRLDGVEFYELMQAYRHAPLTDQKQTTERYEAVIDWIRKNYKNKNKNVIGE